MWFTALCGALVFWAGWYMSEYGGGGKANVLDPRPEMRFPARAGGEKKVDEAALGKKLYTAQCVSCHQQSGAGIPGQASTAQQSRRQQYDYQSSLKWAFRGCLHDGASVGPMLMSSHVV